MPLTEQNIESELSYAYLHAVASRAGLNCQVTNRHSDNYGVDAIVDFTGVIEGTYRTDVTLRVQLKATKKQPSESDASISYFFSGVEQYDKLRENRGEPHRVLIVLFLPEDPDQWLACTKEQLVLKKSAYWVCLYDAPKTANTTGQTIYLPKIQLLTPESLVSLCKRIGKGDIPSYSEESI